MIDLCLVNPPHPALVEPHAQAPLGLLYLAAVVEQAGMSVRIVNLTSLSTASYHLPPATCYGITGTFLDVAAIHALVTGMRSRGVKSRILVGGPVALSACGDLSACHAQAGLSACHAQADAQAGLSACGDLSAPACALRAGKCHAQADAQAGLSATALPIAYIDALVHGEAENSIVDYVNGKPPANLDPPADLNALPFPARHLWHGPFGGNIFINGRNYFGGGTATIITTRGCPFKCAFCAGPALSSRIVRFRSAESVVAEMEQVGIDFGVRQFRFSDEYFTCKRSHVQQVCERILRSRVLGHGDGLAWRASIGVNPHDLDLFKIMRTAGCREVSLGIESADPEVLSLLCRKGFPEDALAALENARHAGLRTRALMMIGTPGERRETLSYNLRFIRTAPYDALAITIFTPIPGSAIAADPQRFGCRIIPGSLPGLCLYGPGGRREIEPTIDVDGLGRDELIEQMTAVVEAAEATGKLGHG